MDQNKQVGQQGETLVYLVRHGVTEWNLQKRFQGHLDVPLNREGMAQAEAVGKWLEGLPVRFTALYSSDLTRAMQTAEAISRWLNLTVEPVVTLREIHCGEWQGLSVDEVNARYPGQLDEWYEKVDSYKLPGGESIPDVQARIFAFYEGIVQKHAGEAIVIVSHGAALTALQTAIHDLDLLDTWRSRSTRMGNTGVTALSINPYTGKAHTIIHNSAEHLAHPTGMASVLDPSA